MALSCINSDSTFAGACSSTRRRRRNATTALGFALLCFSFLLSVRSVSCWSHLVHHAVTAAHHVHHFHHQAAAVAAASGGVGVGGGAGDASTLHLVQTAATTAAHQASHAAKDALDSYKHLLATFPLPTKMATGATLAVAGDAIAQRAAAAKSAPPSSSDDDDASAAVVPTTAKYDKRRAASFAVFDSAYRALQHSTFPYIVQHCHGTVLAGLVAAVLPLHHSTELMQTIDSYSAAMEQTLASQLGIVPFLYYPAFFALTGAVQGLDFEQAVDRAKENFFPLMKRNLLFWIPVQFVQFGFVPEDLQIPFLSVCGLAWTFILSMAAGSAKQYISSNTNGGVVPGATTASQGELAAVSDAEVVVGMAATADLAAQTVFQEEENRQQQQQQQQQQQPPVSTNGPAMEAS